MRKPLSDEERKKKNRKARAYSQRPEVKERSRSYNQRPEVKERNRIRDKAYRKRPEQQEKRRIYEKKPERIARRKITGKLYSQVHKERISKRQKAYLQRPEIKERNSKREKAYKQRPEIKERDSKLQKINRKNLKNIVLTEYSKRISGVDHPICACCGEDFHEIFLTIDHIEPISKTKIEKRGNQGIYRKLERRGYPEGYQVLCINCNQAKGTAEKCPHQRSR